MMQIIEDNFAKRSTTSYKLSILVGMDSFFYLISDAQQNVLVLKSYDFDQKIDSFDALKEPFQKIFIEDELLQLPYLSTKVAFVNHQSTLVPNRLFDDNRTESYLEHLTTLKDTDLIEVDNLHLLDSLNVYAIDRDVLTIARSYFPNADIHHSLTPLILGYHRLTEHQDGHQIFINVHKNLAQIVLFQDRKLLFCNTFGFQSAKDFIYYSMLIFDQFNLKPETTPLLLSGKILQHSDIYSQLYRYIRRINFVKTPVYYRLGKKLSEQSEHFYFDLFSLKLCE